MTNDSAQGKRATEPSKTAMTKMPPISMPRQEPYPVPITLTQVFPFQGNFLSGQTAQACNITNGDGSLAEVKSDIIASRKRREFTPDERKDDCYWNKRRKNNEAAKRSREKRRMNDMMMEQRLLALTDENCRLKAELVSLKKRFGIDQHGKEDKVTAAATRNEEMCDLSEVNTAKHVPPAAPAPVLGEARRAENDAEKPKKKMPDLIHVKGRCQNDHGEGAVGPAERPKVVPSVPCTVTLSRSSTPESDQSNTSSSKLEDNRRLPHKLRLKYKPEGVPDNRQCTIDTAATVATGNASGSDALTQPNTFERKNESAKADETIRTTVGQTFLTEANLAKHNEIHSGEGTVSALDALSRAGLFPTPQRPIAPGPSIVPTAKILPQVPAIPNMLVQPLLFQLDAAHRQQSLNATAQAQAMLDLQSPINAGKNSLFNSLPDVARTLENLQFARSSYMEYENDQLRDTLRTLSSDIACLKDIVKAKLS
ncbi:uncharacterized protein [Ptychodera flava]|uniref:uncharacterized protein n=1 Tax=Ptychodera flava TaxID=63121 RepID=UPI00396A1F13